MTFFSEHYHKWILKRDIEGFKPSEYEFERYGTYRYLEGKFATNPMQHSCIEIHNELCKMAKEDGIFDGKNFTSPDKLKQAHVIKSVCPNCKGTGFIRDVFNNKVECCDSWHKGQTVL